MYEIIGLVAELLPPVLILAIVIELWIRGDLDDH